MAQTAIRRLFWVFLLRARCKHGMRFEQGIHMYGVTTAGLLMKVSEALTCYGQVSLSCRALLRVQNCRDNVYLLAEAAACAQQLGRVMPYCQLKARSRKWLSHCSYPWCARRSTVVLHCEVLTGFLSVLFKGLHRIWVYLMPICIT